jgi:hypothetical protein
MGLTYPHSDSDNDNTRLIQNGEIAIRPHRNIVIIHEYGWRFYLSLILLIISIFVISILLALFFNYIFYKKSV